MRSLFPFFGGKARVAPQVWAHLGDPECYIEPFAGSLAVLLDRPTPARVEIAVDLDGLLLNFWRTIKYRWTDMNQYLMGAVSEIDAYSKHAALLDSRVAVNEKLRSRPGVVQPDARCMVVGGHLVLARVRLRPPAVPSAAPHRPLAQRSLGHGHDQHPHRGGGPAPRQRGPPGR